MKKVFELISEQTSPLFRIMTIYNDSIPSKRQFANNISASHIGDGFILSVAHNLRLESKLIPSIDDNEFKNAIITKCNSADQQLMSKCYIYDKPSNKHFLQNANQNDSKSLMKIFESINYDTRWKTQYSKNMCKPFLIIQFKNQDFYNDKSLTSLLNKSHIFPEPNLHTNTFLLELSLVKAFFAEDMALYKIVNVDPKIIARIPAAQLNYEFFKIGESFNCLQSSPSGTNLGYLFNESRIEGILEQHQVFKDKFGGNYFFEGLRYLLKGYFRFGSSGAPYFSYNLEKECYEVNALQSEASPIQLSIKNDRNGNFQYVNAIATPLYLIKDKLKNEINIS